jgi:hypothetical protein
LSSYFFFLRALSRSVRIINRYWVESSSPWSSPKTLAVHSWTERLANSLCLSWIPTTALRRYTLRLGRRGRHHSRTPLE